MRARAVGVTVLFVAAGAATSARAAWSPAVTLSPSGDDASAVRAAMGSRGDQAVVWSRRVDSYNSTVELALHRPGTPGFSVSTISDLQPPPQSRGDGITTGQNYDPAVAIAPDGEMAAIWAWSPGMRAIVIPPGASTGTRVTLGIDNTTTSYPGIDYDGAGNATAFWRSPDDTLMAAYRPAGGQFGTPRAIPNPDGNAPGHPQYAVAESGDAFATWTNGFNVFVSIRKAGQSSFGDPQTLSDKESPAPHIAVDPRGDAVVTWVDRPDPYANGTVEASYRPAGGRFGSAVPLGQVFFTGTFEAFPAMSRNGEATVAWLGNVLDPAFDAQITAITRSPSGTWGPYEQVSNQDGGDTYANAYDGQGNTYALWTHDRAYAALRPAGQRFSGAETPLSEQGQGGEGPVDAAIAASPIGTGAIAAWEFGRSPEEPKNRVEASVFTNPPGQTQPGTPTTIRDGTQSDPSNSDGSSPSGTDSNRSPMSARRSVRCIKATRAVRRASRIRHHWAARYRHHRTHRNRRKLRAARTRLLHALHTRSRACMTTH